MKRGSRHGERPARSLPSRMATPRKRTIQVEFWTDDDTAAAAFVKAVCLSATAAFGIDNQNVIHTGVGVKNVRQALEATEWASANVKGRMCAS